MFELLRLVRVLEDEGVEVAVASDLEFGLGGVAELVLLYPRGYSTLLLAYAPCHLFPRVLGGLPSAIEIVELRQRTGGILPPADLDELLDVGDFARHLERECVGVDVGL